MSIINRYRVQRYVPEYTPDGMENWTVEGGRKVLFNTINCASFFSIKSARSYILKRVSEYPSSKWRVIEERDGSTALVIEHWRSSC